MSHFILATLAPEFAIPRAVAPIQIRPGDLAASAAKLTAGDFVLILGGKGASYDALLGRVFRVSRAQGQACFLELDRAHNSDVPAEAVRQVISRGVAPGLTEIQPPEFEALTRLMGDVRMTESQLLVHIKRSISARGYYFDDETIANYHVCLKTRPLVILAGLSGTGKSKLSQLYAEAAGHSTQNARYLRLAVRPSWNDDRFLLGYFNTLSREYVTEPALDFVLRAERDRDNLYFLCLDEMNLAHVEYYFSQFLSALEEENPSDRVLHLFGEMVDRQVAPDQRRVDRTAIISPNLLFTGTINVDETTQHISYKVIDRANTLEFFDVDLDRVPRRQATPEPVRVTFGAWQSYRATEPDMSRKPAIVEINRILQKAGFGLGYRVLNEIGLYLANSSGLLDAAVAFDLQVKQRILPRLRGTTVIEPMLNDLLKFARDQKLDRTARRLDEMRLRLQRDAYTSFWR